EPRVVGEGARGSEGGRIDARQPERAHEVDLADHARERVTRGGAAVRAHRDGSGLETAYADTSLGSASESPITIQSGRDVSVSMNIDESAQPMRLRTRAFEIRLRKCAPASRARTAVRRSASMVETSTPTNRKRPKGPSSAVVPMNALWASMPCWRGGNLPRSTPGVL